MALKRTLGELGSIGRNLNQIAHAANQGQLVTSPGRNDLEAMLRVCGTLRDSLKRVLLANLKSWEQGLPSRSSLSESTPLSSHTMTEGYSLDGSLRFRSNKRSARYTSHTKISRCTGIEINRWTTAPPAPAAESGG